MSSIYSKVRFDSSSRFLIFTIAKFLHKNGHITQALSILRLLVLVKSKSEKDFTNTTAAIKQILKLEKELNENVDLQDILDDIYKDIEGKAGGVSQAELAYNLKDEFKEIVDIELFKLNSDLKSLISKRISQNHLQLTLVSDIKEIIGYT